ncbi:hypothetical protein BWI89_28310 (plasmid) [Escherichia coli]|nr:hypothetical protein BWI89_28310 [Escherichia coli]
MNEALRHNSTHPEVIDLAHANNAAMQAEAERLRLQKQKKKLVKKRKLRKRLFLPVCCRDRAERVSAVRTIKGLW